MSRGYLYTYRTRGWRDGRADAKPLHESAHECLSCGCTFAPCEDTCECGCREEYRHAYYHARGSDSPMRVSLVERGGWIMSGEFRSPRVARELDAWDFRSALAAARYLRSAATYRSGRHGAFALAFSYVPRDLA